MTKKDYALLAKVVLDTRTDHVTLAASDNERHAIRVCFTDLANRLAVKLAEDNALFDRARFLKAACGD